MPITLNGTTGVVTPGATVGSITGVLKATSGVVSQAVAGSDYGQLTLATAQTASGTAVDFTGIPSWAKRVTVLFNGVSLNGSSTIKVQLGAGSFQTTGYVSIGTKQNVSGVVDQTSTSGFALRNGIGSSYIVHATMILSLISGTNWISTHAGYTADGVSDTGSICGGGSVSLSGTLDRVRITANGSDTFDAGTINISYE